ncbi:protein trichome birefringence-like 6 [Prunus persica]|uniref:protein trichome birefringence-like 6 n=1 Tax=Prunus persica TaxID=3760 RepID=UPI0009AB89C5|nr:protein trichome birefringence-like 6 [Prunus persica]
MKRQPSLFFKLPTRSLVFYFSLSSSIIFLTFIIIWVNNTTPPNSVVQAQEIGSCLQFNTSSLVSGFRPPIGALPVHTNFTGNFNTNISVTVNGPEELVSSKPDENTSGFSGMNSLVSSGLQTKENQSQVPRHDEEDRGGGELDGNFTAAAQSTPAIAPAILFDKIELSTEEQNAPLMNKTEEQTAQSMTKTEEKNAPLMNMTEEQNASLMNKTEEQSTQLMTKTEEQNVPLRNTTEEENAPLLNTVVEQTAPLMNKTEEQTAPLMNKTEVQDAPLMNMTEEQNAASGFSGINSLASGLQRKENESQVAEVAQSAPAVSFDKIEIKTEEQKAPVPLMNKTEEQNAASSKRIEVRSRSRRGKNKKNRGTSFDQKTQVSSSEVVQAEDKKIIIKGGCDFSTRGRWVYDKSYPLYTNRSCPFIFEGFDCQGNGRSDKDYMRWRWQPQDCDIPRFNAKKMLELLRGKRLLYVGDSINRNQFESMVCMLVGDIKDPNRPRIKHEKGMYSFSFVDYKCKVEFSPSVFLVDKSMKRVGKKQVLTLRIDSIDHRSYRWIGADIVIFDTAHWWTDQKTNAGVNFYQEGDQIHPYLDVYTALRKGMMTWASWVDKHTDPSKTQVFFRTSSPTHFSGGEGKSRRSCIGATEPLLRDSGIANEKDRIAVEVIKQMKTRVTLLNITSMSEYRIDAHPSGILDCSHWCLPGLPDIWNELLYHHLLTN